MASAHNGNPPAPGDLTRLSVGLDGGVHRSDHSTWVVMTDETGAVFLPVTEYLKTLAASGASQATLRSYALALLRWWRFLRTARVGWHDATSVDVRNFVLWMQAPHSARPVSGRRAYAPATINHNLAVLHSYYAVTDQLRGNPVPSAIRRHSHHNPMHPFSAHRRSPLRQKMPRRIPRGLSVPAFNALFASLRSDRDRALLAFYVSTGARATELLEVTEDRVDVGRQVIGIHRKGTKRLQWLPASPDSFVWLRLYQQRQPRPGGEQALWLTLRPPHRPLTYSAARRVLQRANAHLDTRWTLHDLRHTAAKRMAADPQLPLTDIQWVLGHAHLTTTQVYLEPHGDEVVSRVLEHYERRDRRTEEHPTPPIGSYSPETLRVLLGESHVPE